MELELWLRPSAVDKKEEGREVEVDRDVQREESAQSPQYCKRRTKGKTREEATTCGMKVGLEG